MATPQITGEQGEKAFEGAFSIERPPGEPGAVPQSVGEDKADEADGGAPPGPEIKPGEPAVVEEGVDVGHDHEEDRRPLEEIDGEVANRFGF